MSRFDQTEGVDYGFCTDCGLALPTEDDARSHRAETMEPGQSSHRTRAMNPTREERVQQMVDSAVESAITDALDEIQGDVDAGHVTGDEVVEALKWYSDFHDEWVRTS